jgi:hypothetical protein
MTRSSPKVEGLNAVFFLGWFLLPSTVTMLEGGFFQGHRSLLNSIWAIAGVFILGNLIYWS